MTEGQTMTGKALAELFELTPRRVQQLAKEGVFPKIARGRYPLEECVRGYVNYWKERAEGRFTETELDQARLAREQLEVRKRAIEVARAEGSVVSLQDHEEVLGKLLVGVRGVVLSIPGAWGTRVIGIETPGEGLQRMTKLADEIMAGVASTSAEFDIEDMGPPEMIPDDFPGFRALVNAGIETMEALRGMDDFTQVKGIGEKTAERLEEAVAA